MRLFKIVLLKEFKDFVYSYKCWFNFILIILGMKIIASRTDYSLFFHSWFITLAIQQFVYDSFLTDIKEKGILFLSNIKCPFPLYFFSKLIVVIIVYLFMFLFELPTIVKDYNFIKCIYVFLLSTLSLPVMFTITTLAKSSEVGGVIFSSITMGIIYFCFSQFSINIISTVILITLWIILFFLMRLVFNSMLFRKQI